MPKRSQISGTNERYSKILKERNARYKSSTTNFLFSSAYLPVDSQMRYLVCLVLLDLCADISQTLQSSVFICFWWQCLHSTLYQKAISVYQNHISFERILSPLLHD